MPRLMIIAGLLLLACGPLRVAPAKPDAAWDSRCEECHGDADKFAGKYLWAIGGQLQGRHHVRDLRLFMSNHYIPGHMLDIMQNMLMKYANTPQRFADECGRCHGKVEDFVEKSVAFKWGKVRGLKSGTAVSEFLPDHEGLKAEDAEFFASLLERFVDQEQ